MPETNAPSPAEIAAQETIAKVFQCIDTQQSFLLEAGAGAGKTYSLVEALKHVCKTKGKQLAKQNQQVACITFTNVASNEIEARTDHNPVIYSSTIHSFCWLAISRFQSSLRTEIQKLPTWQERLAEIGGELGSRTVEYTLGYPKIEETTAFLHHNDVISLTVALLNNPKFCQLLASRFPIIFIDEYQDTDKEFASSLCQNFLKPEAPELLIGFFGDHWQKIYGNGCGTIESGSITRIYKGANFRSVPAVVEVLNRIRPELKQLVADPVAQGTVSVFHTNEWKGMRRSESHWKNDLPADAAHAYLDRTIDALAKQGWDFTTPETSKILMLTHRTLATEQGYDQLLSLFSSKTEALIKAEDPDIAFFKEIIEPACMAYSKKTFGDMFSITHGGSPAIRSKKDKEILAKEMDGLVKVRHAGNIGDVLEYARTMSLQFPNAIDRREKSLQEHKSSEEGDKDLVKWMDDFRSTPYQQVIALFKFIEGYTPFSTKHGVKGAEFENVLVVIGRGWNQYDFNAMLEFAEGKIPSAKQDFYERNRNLFYVACSRPKTNLALLFTQYLSPKAIATLGNWFGPKNIKELPAI